MKFCSKCGTLMNLDRERQAYICPRCGAVEAAEISIIYSKSGASREKVAVIGKEELNLRTTPKVKITCPKCGNETAYWWMVQTRGVDESMTQFYRCTKCGHTWREYG